MIVLPPDLERETIEVERNLLKKELRRFVEFADLADNAGEARIKLLALQKRYGLLDIWTADKRRWTPILYPRLSASIGGFLLLFVKTFIIVKDGGRDVKQ